MSIKRFNGMVRKAIMSTQRAKIREVVSLTASTSNTQRLLVADDDPDYELVTATGTIAECESLCRLRAIKLNVSYFAGTSNAAGARVEWLLYRDVDNAALVTNPSDLFAAADSPTNREIRKNTIAYGGFFSSANNDTRTFRINISRKAFRRIRRMADGDSLELVFFTEATGAKYFITGAIDWMK